MQSLSIAEAQEITFDTSEVPDIHAYLAGLRAHGPIARSKMGVVFALRHQHLELITRDVTRQIETETKLIQGIVSGPIFDFVKSSMLFSNGDIHLRRRAPVSRTFAFKLMDAMRPKAAALAAWHLGRLGPASPRIEQALLPLRQLAGDEDPSVRVEAALALGMLEGKGAPPPELKSLSS